MSAVPMECMKVVGTVGWMVASSVDLMDELTVVATVEMTE